MGGFQPVRINPPQQTDLLGNVGKLMQLKQMQQQGPLLVQRQQEELKAQQLQNEQQQRDMEDQQKIRDAFMQAGGDMDRTIDLAAKSGVQPKTVFALKAQYLDQKTKLATLDKDTLANHAKQAELVGGTAQSILALPPEQRLQAAQQGIQSLAQQGIVPPDQAQQLLQGLPQDPAQLEQFLKLHALAGQSSKDQIAQIQKQQEMAETHRRNQAMEQNAVKNPTEASLAMRASQGDAAAEAALKRLDKSKAAGRASVNIMTPNDAKDIADAIANGDQPPTVQGLYRNAGPVRAELARRHVPIAKMETDWKATQRFMASANSTQQLRLQQSIASASELLPKLEQLYSEWKQLAPVSGFKIANHAALIAMKNLPGRAGAVAMALDTQISELTADLGNIYMGGNSPTDQALKLGAKALSSEWGPEAFEEGIKQAKLNVGIRQNSMKHAGPVGLSGTTNYAPQAQPEAPAQGGGDFFSKFGGTKR